MNKIENYKKTVKIMEEEREIERFDFILYINNNIICHRNFNIYNFNENSVKSIDVLEMVNEIAGPSGILPTYLKEKSINYLWENYNPYYNPSDSLYVLPSKKGDIFKFEIMVDKRVIGSTSFINDYFTLSSTVSVNIREIIPMIMTEIRQTLSKKKYMNLSL